MPDLKPSYVILLTASIDPKGMTLLRRSDPLKRLADYKNVLSFLIKTTTYPIVFCENSGYDLTPLHALDHEQSRVEFLQFDGQQFPRSLGKGYGEMLIMKYALVHSKQISSADYVIKITGRYCVKNISDIINSVITDSYVTSDYNSEARYTYSGFFISKPEFVQQYLLPFQNFLNDEKNQSMEVALHKAITMAIIDGKKSDHFAVKPRISGYSGTWNVEISDQNFNDIKMSWPKLKIKIRAYVKAGLRRLKIRT